LIRVYPRESAAIHSPLASVTPDPLARLQIPLLLSSFAIIAADEAIIWFEFLIGSSGRPS
jgi:hypothetical protein